MKFTNLQMEVLSYLQPDTSDLESEFNLHTGPSGVPSNRNHYLVISGELYAGPEVDVWSCDIILYALLCGELAFDDENTSSLIRKIKNAIFNIPRHVSDGARDLIRRMLVVDPIKRITIPEIRQHPWFQVQLPQYLELPLTTTLQQETSSIQEASSSSASTEHQFLGVTNHLGKKWALGFQSGANPRNIMVEVLSALYELKVSWKRISSYNMKCRWFPSLQENEGILNHVDGEPAIVENCGGSTASPDMVKFEMQLYKTGNKRYVVDLQRVDGPQLLFLDICASLFAQLRDPYRRLHRSMVHLAV